MIKIKSLIYSLVVVLLFGGMFYFQTILDIFTPSPAARLAPEVARSQSGISHVNSVPSKAPSWELAPTREQPASQSGRQKLQPSPTSQRDGQGHREEQADTVSLPTPERRSATTDLTALERLRVERQRVLEEQLEQEAAAYEESLRSTEQPRAFADLTELEQLQLEEQRLLEEQLEQEAAAYEESLRSTTAAPPQR